MYHLATMHSIIDRQTDGQTTVLCQQPIIRHAAVWSAKNAMQQLVSGNIEFIRLIAGSFMEMSVKLVWDDW